MNWVQSLMIIKSTKSKRDRFSNTKKVLVRNEVMPYAKHSRESRLIAKTKTFIEVTGRMIDYAANQRK